jgi:hypothetical protein
MTTAEDDAIRPNVTIPFEKAWPDAVREVGKNGQYGRGRPKPDSSYNVTANRGNSRDFILGCLERDVVREVGKHGQYGRGRPKPDSFSPG